jgi:hypothetical protein
MNGPNANWGHPVAYHPMLSHFFESVNAAIFFCQLRYWSDRTEKPLGVYKTSEEWTAETGLSYREQATARRILSEPGFVVETNKRLSHRLYFLIDWDAFNPAFSAWVAANPPAPKAQTPNNAKRISPNDENAIGGGRKRRSSISTETTAEITAEKGSADAQDGFAPPPMTGAICMVMKASGMQGVNPNHPDLQVLIDKGADAGLFAEVARDCVAKGKPFSYALAVIKGQMKDAAALADTVMSKPAATTTAPRRTPPADNFQASDYGQGGKL